VIRWGAYCLGLLLVAGAAAPLADRTPLAERRRQLAAMSEPDKADLERCFREFSQLPPEERDRLRQLHAQIDADPDPARLRGTLQRYCRWLASLPPFRRNELSELKPDERVKRIKQMLEEQAKWEAKRPSSQDLTAFTRWLEQYVGRNEAEVVRTMPDVHRRRLEESNPATRKRLLMWWRWQAVTAGVVSPPSAADFAELRQSLSPDTRARLESKSVAEQTRIVGGWLKYTPVVSAWKGGLRAVDEKQLSHFFEHELTDEQRDRLLGMPPEQMQHELLRLYHGPHARSPEALERRAERGGKRPAPEAFAPWRKPPPDRPLVPGLLEPRPADDKPTRGRPAK
jgi:hypothetical protein